MSSVLLLSYDPEAAEVLRLRFELEGFSVKTPANNSDALKLLTSKQQPQLVIADVATNDVDELNAYQELLEIAGEKPGMKRMLILPRGTSKSDQKKTGWPADKVLAKPFELEAFVATAKGLLRN